MAPRARTDLRGLLRRCSAENERCFISDIPSLLRARGTVWLGGRAETAQAPGSGLASLSALLSSCLGSVPDAAFSLTCHLCSAPLYSPLRSSIFPTSPLHSCSSSWRSKLQCITQYISIFCPNSFTHKYPFQLVFGLVQGSWLLEQHKCWVIVGPVLDILLLPRVKVMLQLDEASGASSVQAPGLHTSPCPRCLPHAF